MPSQLCTNHFRVDWGGTRIGFTEVSGLSIELDVVPYRDGASPDSTASLVPGQKRFSPVVLRRGIVPGDNDFFNWINSAQFGDVQRRDVTIQLLNGQHNPVVTWRLTRAFPSRLDYAPLSALGSEIAIESLTLVHEGLRVEHA
jgi:phage tail-like protein